MISVRAKFGAVFCNRFIIREVFLHLPFCSKEFVCLKLGLSNKALLSYHLLFINVQRHYVFWRHSYLRSPPGSGLNDGQWHAVRLVAKENFAMLTIDSEEASAVRSTSTLTITTGGTYHLGGKHTQRPSPQSRQKQITPHLYFVRCHPITFLSSFHYAYAHRGTNVPENVNILFICRLSHLIFYEIQLYLFNQRFLCCRKQVTSLFVPNCIPLYFWLN